MKKTDHCIIVRFVFLSNTAVISAEEIISESDETILDSYELNPDTLHVNKLGETDDISVAEEMEPHKLGGMVRVSIVLDDNAIIIETGIVCVFLMVVYIAELLITKTIW